MYVNEGWRKLLSFLPLASFTCQVMCSVFCLYIINAMDGEEKTSSQSDLKQKKYFQTVGVLSLFLCFGLWLDYINQNRLLQLAKMGNLLMSYTVSKHRTFTLQDYIRWSHEDTPSIFHPFQPKDSYERYMYSGIFIKYNVCIEASDSGQLAYLAPDREVPMKRLVIYNSNRTDEETKWAASCAAHNVSASSWTFTHRKGNIPDGHVYFENHPAYFAIPSCTGHLWHLWVDMLMGLYGILKATRRLGIQNGNFLFYKAIEPLPDSVGTYHSCWNMTRFEEFMFALGIHDGHDIYHNAPSNICFKKAVFGQKYEHNKREITDFIIQKFSGREPINCQPKTITFIDRKSYRKILNLEELKQAALDLHFPNVNVVYLEELDFYQQYSVARCTDILVGITGAGLEWCAYMKTGRGIIELTYEKRNFEPIFHNNKGIRGLMYMRIEAKEVLPNKNTAKKILKWSKNRSMKNFPPKFSDGVFDVHEFKSKLAHMATRVFSVQSG